MKMVKSLLLGSAAGLVAVAGAQAADLPVKAKPVQYVKICSLYGAGFYYIPGTDTCIKVGGWIRQYIGVGADGDLTNGPLGNNNANSRLNNNGWTWKTRGYITADARTQTEYGTVRGYLDVGGSTSGSAGNSAFNANRGFIQWAGFTFGVTQSFFDLYSMPAISYFGGMINPTSDTGDGGTTVTAYTGQFGNGFSASIALEAPRTTDVYNASVTAFTGQVVGATLGNSAAAVRYPDIVANLRVDQSWGSAQIMGAIHDVAGTYYGANPTAVVGGVNGAPGYTTGWALGAGFKINTPVIGKGDYVGAQFNYSVGAMGYPDAGASIGQQGGSIAGAPAGAAAQRIYGQYTGGSGTSIAAPLGNYGFGLVTDGVYGAANGVGSSIQLTTAWNINAGYEHFWTPHWQTSIYGTYMAVTYGSSANAMLCANEGLSTFTTGVLTAGVTGCNNNWNHWTVGTRTQFNIDSQTYIGLDVIYEVLDQNNTGVTPVSYGATGTSTGSRSFSDQSAWIAEFRMHRNFYP
jgi:Porin subfamily